MQLSNRLTRVAANVCSGGVVADIGCDHGFTSIYLVKNGLAKRAIAMDINEGPLERANAHIMEYDMQNLIETRLSDGARKLSIGEADTILISGMGGALMTRILSDSLDVVEQCEELVLSPQSEVYLIRHFLHDHGFKIAFEEMVYDQAKYYVVIRAVKGQECYESQAEYIYGKVLIDNKDSVFINFLDKELKRVEKILDGMSGATLSDNAVKQRATLNREHELLTDTMKRVK